MSTRPSEGSRSEEQKPRTAEASQPEFIDPFKTPIRETIDPSALFDDADGDESPLLGDARKFAELRGLVRPQAEKQAPPDADPSVN